MFYFVSAIIIIIIRTISCTDNFMYGYHHFMWFLRFYLYQARAYAYYVSFFCFPWVGYQVLRPLTLRSFEGHLFYYLVDSLDFPSRINFEKPILLRRVAIHARSYIRIKSSARSYIRIKSSARFSDRELSLLFIYCCLI